MAALSVKTFSGNLHTWLKAGVENIAVREWVQEHPDRFLYPDPENP